MPIFIFILFASLQAFALPKDLVHSASVLVNTVNSDSRLQDKNKKDVLTFMPNVSTAIGLAAETEYVGFAYFFSGKEAQSKKYEKSKYRDLRFNFHLKHFDFRVNYQNYRGAIVEDGGKNKFYKDYEVKSTNGRIHYYFNNQHLNYIRDGRKLVNKSYGNKGFGRTGSWFLGMNVDSRKITLPENLEAEHLAVITSKNLKYDRSFSSISWGPMGGFDGILLFGSAFLRGKLAIGPAFQSDGGTVTQSEFALNSGFSFFKNHLLSIGFDFYNMNFKDNGQRISNNNSQVGFGYTYAFN